MTTDDLACQELVELLSDHLEGTLSADDQRRVVAHVSGCGGCQAALEQLRETIHVAGGLHEDPVPKPARERIRAAFLGWRDTASS